MSELSDIGVRLFGLVWAGDACFDSGLSILIGGYFSLAGSEGRRACIEL